MKSKYEDENEDTGVGFAAGLFVGAVIGGCAALLFTPKSGAQTRQELRDLADKQKENLKNQWERTKEKANEAVNTAKDKVDSMAWQAPDTVDIYAKKTKSKVDQLADDAKATVDKFKKGNDPATHRDYENI